DRARYPHRSTAREASGDLPDLRCAGARTVVHPDQRSRPGAASSPVQRDPAEPVRVVLPRERPGGVAREHREAALMLSLSTEAAPRLSLDELHAACVA